LTAAEKADLEKYEEIIGQGFGTFFEVGQALGEVKSGRLYREGYSTFEDYCREKWQYDRSYAYRLIGAQQVVAALLPIGDNDTPLPKNECQVRPLVGLEDRQIITAWKKAIELAGNNAPTAELVKKAAAKFRRKTGSRKTKDVGSEPKAKSSAEAELASNLVSTLREAEREVQKLTNCETALPLVRAAMEMAEALQNALGSKTGSL